MPPVPQEFVNSNVHHHIGDNHDDAQPLPATSDGDLDKDNNVISSENGENDQSQEDNCASSEEEIIEPVNDNDDLGDKKDETEQSVEDDSEEGNADVGDATGNGHIEAEDNNSHGSDLSDGEESEGEESSEDEEEDEKNEEETEEDDDGFALLALTKRRLAEAEAAKSTVATTAEDAVSDGGDDNTDDDSNDKDSDEESETEEKDVDLQSSSHMKEGDDAPTDINDLKEESVPPTKEVDIDNLEDGESSDEESDSESDDDDDESIDSEDKADSNDEAVASSIEESKDKNRRDENAELWALLNASKKRLSEAPQEALLQAAVEEKKLSESEHDKAKENVVSPTASNRLSGMFQSIVMSAKDEVSPSQSVKAKALEEKRKAAAETKELLELLNKSKKRIDIAKDDGTIEISLPATEESEVVDDSNKDPEQDGGLKFGRGKYLSKLTTSFSTNAGKAAESLISPNSNRSTANKKQDVTSVDVSQLSDSDRELLGAIMEAEEAAKSGKDKFESKFLSKEQLKTKAINMINRITKRNNNDSTSQTMKSSSPNRRANENNDTTRDRKSIFSKFNERVKEFNEKCSKIDEMNNNNNNNFSIVPNKGNKEISSIGASVMPKNVAPIPSVKGWKDINSICNKVDEKNNNSIDQSND